ncbi:MAG: ABC transporter ATP-binding protein [Planctomycetota bacterium]
MSDRAILAQGLNKKYKVYGAAMDRVKEAFYRGRKRFHREVWALRDINLEVPHGSALGVVGSNGAGKSTLLKILAGTTTPSSGKFEVNGRVASLLELGTGFHTGFTGRQNIFLNAIVMGFSRQEVKAKLDEIIEFSELGPFIDAPVRTYSSGMVMRLGFSVATAIDPDVLIIDEILAVGDLHFQKKCIDRIFQFRDRGKSILFCSHSLYDVRQICDKAVWIKDGGVEKYGDPLEVTHAYANYERARFQTDRKVAAGIEAYGLDQTSEQNLPKIESVQLIDPGSGRETSVVHMGQDLELVIKYHVPMGGRPINLGAGFFRSDGIPCATMATHLVGVDVPTEPGSYTARLRLPNIRLIQGEFHVQGYIVDENAVHIYDHMMVTRPLIIEQRTKEVGLFLMEHEWIIETKSRLSAKETLR